MERRADHSTARREGGVTVTRRQLAFRRCSRLNQDSVNTSTEGTSEKTRRDVPALHWPGAQLHPPSFLVAQAERALSAAAHVPGAQVHSPCPRPDHVS